MTRAEPCVLVVEDDANLRVALAEILASAGYAVRRLRRKSHLIRGCFAHRGFTVP